MPLPDGLTQATEGVTRCPTCHREVIEGRTREGEPVLLSPVLGIPHRECEEEDRDECAL